MPVRRSEQSELDYTTRKIEANFSNFSAWHQRSKVLTTLWETGKTDPAKSIVEGMSPSDKSISYAKVTTKSWNWLEMRCTLTRSTKACGYTTDG